MRHDRRMREDHEDGPESLRAALAFTCVLAVGVLLIVVFG